VKLIGPCILLPPIQISNAVSDSNTIKTFANANGSCPPWFVLSNNSAGNGYSPCECNEDFIICDEKLQKSYLLLNFCMTFNSSSSDEQESDAISFGLSHSTILCEPSSRASMWFALQYLSAFYLLLLIALTYACVELHGHNFRPIVWLWNHFTDLALELEGGGMPKHPLLMHLPHFFFCLTVKYCLCHCIC